LLELRKNGELKSPEKLSSAISGKLGTVMAEVVPLGLMTNIQIVDIDAAADQTEVCEAIRAAITGGGEGRESSKVTGLWTTKSGHQIATAKVREMATELEKVVIGWTMFHVRPRCLPSSRCFRCHAFGHTKASCTRPVLSGACRMC